MLEVKLVLDQSENFGYKVLLRNKTKDQLHIERVSIKYFDQNKKQLIPGSKEDRAPKADEQSTPPKSGNECGMRVPATVTIATKWSGSSENIPHGSPEKILPLPPGAESRVEDLGLRFDAQETHFRPKFIQACASIAGKTPAICSEMVERKWEY